jgi:hypothetical protein
MLDLLSAGVIRQAPCCAQSGDDAALIGFDMENGHASPPSGPRSTRAESAGRKRRALALASLVRGLTLTMTRALGILA